MDDRHAEASLRDVMSGFPTGVTIVAALEDDGEPFGLTVNSFASVSLDPPLVLVCIGHSSTSHDRLVASSGFGISILSAGQDQVALRFATEPSAGRFEGVSWSRAPGGAPVLDDAVAWLECRVERVVEGGDHSILLGRVGARRTTDRPALVFHRGRLGSTDS